MIKPNPITRSAFSLLEMVVVIGVLVVLAGIVLPLTSKFRDDASVQATHTTLTAVRQAIAGAESKPGYVQDVGQLPATLADLFVAPAGVKAYDPVTARGWHGPYLLDASGTYSVNVATGFTTDYGTSTDPAIVDGWNHPLILQLPTDAADPAEKTLYARLVSAGPDGVIQTPESVLYPTAEQRGDDIVIFLNRPDILP